MNDHPVNIPEYWERPQHVSQIWRLSKGRHFATCELWTHPVDGEIRIEVSGEFVRSEAGRDGLALIELALQWRKQFLEKGWTA